MQAQRLVLGVLVSVIVSLTSNAFAICVQTFNTFGPVYAAQIPQRTQLLAQELLQAPCDIVNLQEVWNGEQQSILLNSLKGQFSMSAPNQRMKIGLMSFSKGQIQAEHVQAFKLNSDGMGDSFRELLGVKKGFMSYQLKTQNMPSEIQVSNLHTHPNSAYLRLTQVLDLYQWRLQNQNLPWIVTGDFNLAPGGFSHDFVAALLGVQDVYETVIGGYRDQCTYCDENRLVEEKGGNYVIDYIYVSNISQAMNWKWKIEDAVINLKGTKALPLSDHYGVQAHLSLVPANSSTDIPDLEVKIQKQIEVMAKAQQLLESQNNRDFAPYVRLLKDLQSQLKARSGASWDYFVKGLQ